MVKQELAIVEGHNWVNCHAAEDLIVNRQKFPFAVVNS